jgi:tartrate-resistant acid phosphatase type 5
MRTFLLVAVLLSFVSCKYISTKPEVIEAQAFDDGDKICLVGDTGTGTDKQYLVAHAMEEENCTQIHILGDVIYQNGLKSKDDPQFFEKFKEPYKRLLWDTPIYIGLGNHDYHLNPKAWLDLAKIHENIEMPSDFYAYIHDDICLVTLDTNAYFIRQIKWLKKTASILKNCQYTIMMGHMPYISSGKHGNAPGMFKKFFKNTILKYADAYIAGHDHHLSDEGVHGGVHHFVSGAGAKLRGLKRKPDVWGESKLGFMTINVERNTDLKLRFEFITVDVNSGDRSLAHSGYLD